jgi:uncharacterized protein (DUF736 family)
MSNYDNTNSGVLFKNDKKGNEKAPDYKGKVNIEGKEKDIAGWIREGKSGKFISIKISEMMKKDNVFDNKPKSVFDNKTDLPF